MWTPSWTDAAPRPRPNTRTTLKDKFTGMGLPPGEIHRPEPQSGNGKPLPWKWRDSCSNNWRKPFPGIRNPAQNLSSPLLNDMNRPYYGMLGTVADIQKKKAANTLHVLNKAAIWMPRSPCCSPSSEIIAVSRNASTPASAVGRSSTAGISCTTPRKRRCRTARSSSSTRTGRKITETFRCRKATKFTAGKKADGSDLCYATAEKAYIIPARILAAYALSAKGNHLHITPLLNKEQESLPLVRCRQSRSQGIEYGWLLTSRSSRSVGGQTHRNRQFPSGYPQRYPDARPSGMHAIYPANQRQRGLGADDIYTGLRARDPFTRLTFTLSEGDEAPAACTDELHGITTGHPSLRILFADRELPQTLRIESITVATEVTGIHNFTLIGSRGQLDPRNRSTRSVRRANGTTG